MTITRSNVITISVGILLLLVSVQLLPAAELKLRKKVIVQSSPLTVSKVVKGEFAPELGSVTLGSVPSLGETRYISKTYVKMKAASQGQKIPSIGGNVVRAKVTRRYRTLTRSKLKTVVKRKILQERALGKQGMVTVRKLPAKIKIASGDYQIKLSRKSFYRTSRGINSYRFSVRQQGKETASFRATVSITIDQKVAVTVGRLGRGEELNPSKIEWKKRNVGKLRGIPITKNRKLDRYVMTRSIAPGKILKASHLKRPVVIERRNQVTLRYKKNGLVITTKGKALEEGAIGDHIKVKNLSSEEQLKGQVRSSSLVVISS